MVEKILIKNAAAIVTCDDDDRICENCDILVEGPEIRRIGPGLSDADATIIRADGCFVYPGLVNTHHHFFQTFVRNLLTVDYPSMLVIDWIREIYRIFQRIDADAIYYSSLTAMADLVRHGCTTAYDLQYCYPRHAGKQLVDRQFEAADLVGIRYHAGRGANTLPMDKGSTIPDEMLESTDEFLSDCRRLIETYHDPEPFSMRRIVISPCQPVNCTKETFTEALAMARDTGVYLHTHLGEGENPNMIERWGKRTLDWCEELGFVGEDVWYAHGWELTPEEVVRMAASHTGLSHCPAPAVLGGFDIIDIPAMQKAGLRLGLGVDGSATNDGSNLLDTLRMAFLMQSYHAKARRAAPTPYKMLKICTRGGADLLGRPDLGVLAEGRGADLFMIDVQRLAYAGAVHDPANLLARVGITGPVEMTMVNGRIVFREGRFPGLDEARLFKEAETVCQRVVRDGNPAYDRLKPA